MPVHTLSGGSRKTSRFVLCDKRDDVNRVSISERELEQWRADPEAMCELVSNALGIRRSGQPDLDSGLLAIGVARGAKRSQMLCLQTKGEPALVAGSSSLPLAEAVRFEGGAYSVDGTLIRQMVDASTSADPRYTPSNLNREVRKRETEAKHNAWQRAYRELRKSKPGMSGVWYSRQIEKSAAGGGCKAETIRKHMTH